MYLAFFFLQPWTLLFEYLQLLFYTQMLISYKTLYSILLGHFTLHFMSHFHQELFPQITICLIVCCCCSVAKLCTTLRCQTLVHQAHLSMRFSRQEYWSGLPFPSPVSFIICQYGECVLSRFSRVQLSSTPWTVARQAPLSMGILQVRILGVGCHALLQGSS